MDSDGEVYELPDMAKLKCRKKRCRENAGHRHSRRWANTAPTVVIEDLNTKAMTASAKGYGRDTRHEREAEAGLNREIPASNRGRLERHPDYKAGQVVRVDPVYASQAYAVCGHAANADRNATRNILARGLPHARTALGMGASARREAIPLGTSTTREQGMRWPG